MRSSELNLIVCNDTVKEKRKGIPQDVRTIRMTRRRFIKVKYFKGLPTAI